MTTTAVTVPTTAAPRIPAELNGFCVAAANMADAMKICEFISKSPLIPKAYQNNPAAIWVAGAMGARLGVDLFTSMGGIASINGRPAIWGDLLRGLILSSPLLEDLVEQMEGTGDNLVAVCTIKRKGMSAYTAKFGMVDAKAAGLLGRDTWKQYGPDMLINRAFGRAARRRFSDLLSGLAMAEDLQDAEVIEIKSDTSALAHVAGDGIGAARKPATAVAATKPEKTATSAAEMPKNSTPATDTVAEKPPAVVAPVESTTAKTETAAGDAAPVLLTIPPEGVVYEGWEPLKAAYDAAHKIDPEGATATVKMRMPLGMKWSQVPFAARAELIGKLEKVAGV